MGGDLHESPPILISCRCRSEYTVGRGSALNVSPCGTFDPTPVVGVGMQPGNLFPGGESPGPGCCNGLLSLWERIAETVYILTSKKVAAICADCRRLFESVAISRLPALYLFDEVPEVTAF